MMNERSSLLYLTWLSAIGLISQYIFTGLAGAGVGPFNFTISQISQLYETEIVPASYTFLIWNIIFIWQAAWVIYAIASLYRKNEDGPVYLNPVVLPMTFHLFWILSCGFYIGWLFAWSNQHLFVAFILLLLFTACGYVATAVTAIATSDNIRRISRKDLILNYVLIQNGTDILYAWCTVATLVNLSMALTFDSLFKGSVSDQTACLIPLSILLIFVLTWSVCENTIFFKLFTFVYTWYGVLIWASIGIIVNNYDPSKPTSVLAIVILVIATICLAVKIIVYIMKSKSDIADEHTRLHDMK